MDLLKRHYEKIILLALSIISVFAAWRMAQVMETTKEVKDSDLEIRIPPPDQESLVQKLEKYRKAQAEKNADEVKSLSEDKDFSDYLKTDKFKVGSLVAANGLVWNTSKSRDSKWKNYSSDLLHVFNMAKCPECEGGIPIYCFRNSHKCLICGVHLDTPPDKIRKRRRRTPEDLDGDGIPNDREKSFGMEENYAGDALLDADGDGFSNRFEIMVSNTDPRNPRSCPPLWRRLRFSGMAKARLPIDITSVDPGKSNDPKKWTVSIAWRERDPKTGKLRPEEAECHIGDTLKFEDSTYQVMNIERQKDAAGTELNGYIVTLRMVAVGDKSQAQRHELRLVFGQPVYSPDLRVVLEDIGAPEDPSVQDESDNAQGRGIKRYYTRRGGNKEKAIFILRPGEVFVMGGTSDRGPGRNVQKEIYRMERFDERGKIARLARVRVNPGEDPAKDREGVVMVVTKNSDIDEDDWVSLPTERPAETVQQGGSSRRRRSREAQTDM